MRFSTHSTRTSYKPEPPLSSLDAAAIYARATREKLVENSLWIKYSYHISWQMQNSTCAISYSSELFRCHTSFKELMFLVHSICSFSIYLPFLLLLMLFLLSVVVPPLHIHNYSICITVHLPNILSITLARALSLSLLSLLVVLSTTLCRFRSLIFLSPLHSFHFSGIFFGKETTNFLFCLPFLLLSI